MSDNSKIEWTDASWNPVTGCTEVSPGCARCYAKTFAERFRGTPDHYFEQGFDVVLRPDKLRLPFSWRKPRKVFVNSMSDLFHQAVPDEYIARVFAVMAATPQHTYQVLTKRHGRMRALLSSEAFQAAVAVHYSWADDNPQFVDYESETRRVLAGWPLPNVWLGVSTENQAWANVRIPALLDTPAAVRWISAEPLLGPIDLHGPIVNGHRPRLTYWLTGRPGWGAPETTATGLQLQPLEVGPKLDWVVAGGESGVGARPVGLDWVRVLRDQCAETSTPFLFKQVGGRTSKAGGRELDGRTHDEYPALAAGGVR